MEIVGRRRDVNVRSYVVPLGFFLSLVSARCLANQSGRDSVEIKYQSPIPDAHYVMPSTTIIIRPSEDIDPSAQIGPGLFKVVGSSSGEHDGAVFFSDDFHEIIFKTGTKFASGETVAVDFFGGLKTSSARSVASTHFRFFVQKEFPHDTPGIPQSMLRDFEPPLQSAASISLHQHQSILKRGTTNDTLPLDFPYIVTSVTGATAPGYLFLANNNAASSAPYLMIVDNHGNPIFYRKMGGWCLDFKIQPTGQLSYYDMSREKFFVIDSTYAVTDSLGCGNGYATDPHDLRMMTNGHALLLGDDPEKVDMSTVVPGGNLSATVIGIIVQELDSRKNVVFQWRSWDHFQITDATHEDLTAALVDYVHSNALELDSDGNILLSNRHMDEITKIDRGTGQIIWRWGGKNNQFTMLNDSMGFSHQHAIRMLDNGDIVMFDNGNFHSPNFSRAVEYSIDESNKSASLVWQYRNTPDIYGNAMGYVQRLPGGNTLIGWGTASTAVTEIAPDGSKVFELSFDPGIFSYRAYRFEWNKDTVFATRTIPNSTVLSANYPNPFNGETTFQIDLANPSTVSLAVYDVLGREVLSVLNGERRDAGLYVETIDFSRLSSGMYFCRFNADAFTAIRKVLLLK